MATVPTPPEPVVVGLCFLAAVSYVAGILALKLGSARPLPLIVLAVALAYGLGACFEAMVLRQARVGESFLMIFGFQVTLLAVVALTFLGERYSLRELAGIIAIVAGVALMQSGGAGERAGRTDLRPVAGAPAP